MSYSLALGLILLLIFGCGMALVDKWDRLKRQIVIRVVLFVLFIIGVALGARYWIITAIGCVPNCVGANLVGRDLSGADLSGSNFSAANLSSSNFSKANLQSVNLSGANLERANLEGVDLRNAQLLGTNLTNANLAGANLTGTDLSGAELVEADLTGVDLTQTILKGARLEDAELESVDLSGAKLAAIELVGAKMNGAILLNTDFSGATLSRANLSGARLSGSNLSGAWLNRASLTGADLVNADLSGASLIGAGLTSVDLTNSRMAGTILVGADMNGANLNGANLIGAKLKVDELTDVDLQQDPAILELNELQRSQILVDTRLDGTSFDEQTVWPDVEFAEEVAVAKVTEELSEEELADAIPVGILHSLSGPMAISEIAVRDAALMAIDEINSEGGVLGKRLNPIVEDGASVPEVFAEKVRKLLEKDEVAVIFGGWTSDSRKAMLPALEELNGLLFYPVQYEGFERSPNIFYMGAEPSQQIIPAVEYLFSQGHENILLIGSEFAFSLATNTIIKALLTDTGRQIVAEIYVPLGETEFGTIIEQLRANPPDAIFNALYGESNVAFFQQLKEAGISAEALPVMSASMAEEEIRIIGPEYVAGHLTVWNYFQTLQSPENFAFVTAYKNAFGQERVTSAPIQASYAAVYLWKNLVERANSTAVDDVRAVADSAKLDYVAPEGLLRIDSRTQHTYKTVRIGVVREDGLIEEIFSSPEPLEPDPFLRQYPWADGLEEVLDSQWEDEESEDTRLDGSNDKAIVLEGTPEENCHPLGIVDPVVKNSGIHIQGFLIVPCSD